MGFNYNNPDYDNYVIRFQEAKYPENYNIFSVLDIGYTFIQAWLKSCGVQDYQRFRILLSIFLILLFGSSIISNCKYYTLFFAIYLIFYLALDQVQIRNFFAFVIILPFLIRFIRKPSTLNLLLYILGILISFTVHFSAIFYCVFCLLWIKSKKKRIILTIGCICIFLSIGYITADLALLERTSSYDRPSILGSLVASFMLISNYYYIKYVTTPYNKVNNLDLCYPNLNKYAWPGEVVNQINLLLLVFIPLLFINATILRIWRFISIIDIIYLLNVAYILSKLHVKNKIIIFTIIYAGIILIWFYQPTIFPSLFNNTYII